MAKQAVAQSITPAHPRALTPSKRKRIEGRIEELIAVLDAADPDPDLEPSLCGGPCTDDREDDSADDEPELGWTADINQERALCNVRRTSEFNHSETEHDGREPDVDQEADYIGYPNGIACGFSADMEPEFEAEANRNAPFILNQAEAGQ